MKNMVFLFLVLGLTLACTRTKVIISDKNCNENVLFKKMFYLNIEKVENYTLGKGERTDFNEALKFLSKYVQISFNEMLNYSNSYVNYEAFNKDKLAWLKWYETNKCENIQFK